MPPHCDTLDGPVVKAAKRALETGNVNLILPWAPKKVEGEIKRAFRKAIRVRTNSKDAAELADYWFFETVVRLHRAGENASYTGLKPAGLDWGPIIPKADKAIETGDASDVINFLAHTVHEAVQERFKHAMAKRKYDENDVAAAREYVQAMLGFVLYSHGVYAYVTSGGAHGEGEEGGSGHQH